MSQEPEPSGVSQAAESFSWSEVWLRALTRPSVTTFESLLQDPNATTQRAYIWIAVSALIAYLVSLVLASGFLAVDERLLAELMASMAICGLCGAIIAPLLSVLALIINAGFAHLCARALGGPGTYGQLAYAFASYQAPLALISGALAAIPCVRYLDIAIALYVIVLNVIAVQAVHRFGWGKSVVCAVVAPIVLLVIVACIIIALLTLLGPAVGNVFSTIIEELATPMP